MDIQTIDSVKSLQAENGHIYSFIIVMNSGYTDNQFSKITSSREQAYIFFYNSYEWWIYRQSIQ